MITWFATLVGAPRWFFLGVCAGSGVFALAMGYLAGLSSRRRVFR